MSLRSNRGRRILSRGKSEKFHADLSQRKGGGPRKGGKNVLPAREKLTEESKGKSPPIRGPGGAEYAQRKRCPEDSGLIGSVQGSKENHHQWKAKGRRRQHTSGKTGEGAMLAGPGHKKNSLITQKTIGNLIETSPLRGEERARRRRIEERSCKTGTKILVDGKSADVDVLSYNRGMSLGSPLNPPWRKRCSIPPKGGDVCVERRKKAKPG